MAPSEALSGVAGLDELLEFADALTTDLPELRNADEFYNMAIVKEEPPAVDRKPQTASSNVEKTHTKAVKTKPTKVLSKEEKLERVREKDRQKYYRKKVGFRTR